MKSTITHIAIMSHNAPRLCKFYECLFALTAANSQMSFEAQEERARGFGCPTLSSKRVAKPYDWTVWAGDGNIGVAFLRRRPGYPAGLDHFGIETDDIDEIFKRIEKLYPDVGIVKRPSNRSFADYSTHDPEGNLIDVTPAKRKIEMTGVWTERDNGSRDRRISHLAIRAMKPATVARFYMDVFDFKEREKALEDPNYYVSDGKVTLLISPWKIQDYYGAEHRGPGLDHWGFKVEDVTAVKCDLNVLSEIDPEWMSSKAPNLPDEHDVVMKLLQACRHGQHQFPDPDGNLVDISALG
jgi:catechol 2,3-dioxygenase-like lactoylglutathione lyase family enzyme